VNQDKVRGGIKTGEKKHILKAIAFKDTMQRIEKRTNPHFDKAKTLLNILYAYI
jgi:hypothetical protein